MNLEEENKEKRKNASLTVSEWIGFFLLPINMSQSGLFPSRDVNDDYFACKILMEFRRDVFL